ncbi:MAG: septum formation initiator family protein [Anaerolineae bacterium]|nr:septum formation initiator family protein [Anaerolineae bacterium]
MATKTASETSPRKTGQINSFQVMFAVILAVVLILAINFSSRISAAQPLQEAFSRVQNEIDALEVEHARLTALRDYVMSDPYVERWARDDGKMIRPGEILYVPVPSGVEVEEVIPPPVVLADIQTSEDEVQTWELWWGLFFDSPAPNF